jgi:hypothetical protein
MGIFDRLKRTRKVVDEKSSGAGVEEKVGPVNEDGQAQLVDPGLAGIGALDVMADKIYRDCLIRGWFFIPSTTSAQWTDEVITGVAIRSKHGSVRSSPSEHRGFQEFETAIAQLNCRVAIKMHCKAVALVMETQV